MKKVLLLLILILSFIRTQAQLWHCIDPGQIRYFTNTEGYLKGIRIDSITAIPGGVLLKPFQTLRSRSHPPTNDSLNGSWIGASIIALDNGTCVFRNFVNDSIIIKTLAAAGDSWTLYSDNSNLHYDATIQSADTMTLLGALDSIKTITIQAKDASNNLVANDVNNFKIIISKNHGFVHAIEIYSFPYTGAIDYYLEIILKGTTDISQRLQYSLVDFHNPTRKEMYDYQPGDIMQFSNPAAVYQSSTPYYLSDMIISRTDVNGVISYSFQNDSWAKFYDSYVGFYSCLPGDNAVTHVDTSMLFPHNWIPEERGGPTWNSTNCCYYHPYDTSYCITSALYETYVQNYNVEMTYTRTKYKNKIGKISDEAHCHTGNSSGRGMLYYKINGIECGFPVEIPALNKNAIAVSIYPNPAKDCINLKRNIAGLYTISISNSVGITLYKTTWVNTELTIDTRDFPTGGYAMCISDNNGNFETKKIAVIK